MQLWQKHHILSTQTTRSRLLSGRSVHGLDPICCAHTTVWWICRPAVVAKHGLPTNCPQFVDLSWALAHAEESGGCRAPAFVTVPYDRGGDKRSAPTARPVATFHGLRHMGGQASAGPPCHNGPPHSTDAARSPGNDTASETGPTTLCTFHFRIG